METHQKVKKMKVRDSDRISSLHDSILHHILSFLPVKEVIQSSLVSKRWQELWKSLPYLKFQDNDFRVWCGFGTEDGFAKFLDDFLQKRDKSSVVRFAVRSYWDVFRTLTSTVATSAGGLEELDLSIVCFKFPSHRRFPSCIFNCNSLLTLKLDAPFSMATFPNKFFFPKMKNMHLSYFTLPKTFIHRLLKSPNLENLFLSSCDAYISFSSSDDKFDHMGNWSKLDEADLCLQVMDSDSDGRISIFIRMLSCVKILHLYDSCIKHLRNERNLLQRLPTFWNLKHLELRLSSKNGDIAVVACLLHRSSILQSLHITFDVFDDSQQRETGLILQQFESLCLPPSLKWIRMSEFSREVNQVELLKRFLENESLEKIMVELYACVRDPDLFSNELSLLRPSTSSCHLEITQPLLTKAELIEWSKKWNENEQVMEWSRMLGEDEEDEEDEED